MPSCGSQKWPSAPPQMIDDLFGCADAHQDSGLRPRRAGLLRWRSNERHRLEPCHGPSCSCVMSCGSCTNKDKHPRRRVNRIINDYGYLGSQKTCRRHRNRQWLQYIESNRDLITTSSFAGAAISASSAWIEHFFIPLTEHSVACRTGGWHLHVPLHERIQTRVASLRWRKHRR